MDGEVGLGDVRRAGVGVGEDRDGAQAHRAGGGEDAAGDLAAVGDEQAGDHQSLNTPHPSCSPSIGVVVDDRQRQAEDRAGVARVDDPVVVQPPRQEQRQRLRLDLLLDRGPHRGGRLLVVVAPLRRGAGPADDVHDAGELRRPHDRGLGVGPGEQEAGVVRPAAHAVVAGAVRGPDVDREVRDPAVGHRVDHLRAGLDDAALLVLGPDHVAGGVLQEQQRDVDLVGELDELRGLLRVLPEQHPARVGEHADRVAVDARPAGDERGAVQRLVLVEPAAVDDAGEHLARVERLAQVGRREVEQPVGVEQRRVGGARGPGAALAPVEVAHDLAADPDRVELVDGEVVGAARGAGVHRGAAERLVVGVLAGGHLDQRRAGQEDLAAPVDHDDVVAHAGHVRAAGGAVAEDQRDRRDPLGRQPGEVAEPATARDEDLRLRGQVGAARLDQADVRQPVGLGDVVGPAALAQRVRVGGAAAHRRVVGDDHHLDALDHADARHGAGADREVGAPGGVRRQLEERAVAVEQQLDALARRELAAGAVAVERALAAAEVGLRADGVELGEPLEQGLPVGRHRRSAHSSASGTSTSRERSHSPTPLACGSKRVPAATPSPSSPATWKSTARRPGSSSRVTGRSAASGSRARSRSAVRYAASQSYAASLRA